MLLEMKGIVKRFGHVEALRGVDFHVEKAEIVGLVATTAPASPHW